MRPQRAAAACRSPRIPCRAIQRLTFQRRQAPCGSIIGRPPEHHSHENNELRKKGRFRAQALEGQDRPYEENQWQAVTWAQCSNKFAYEEDKSGQQRGRSKNALIQDEADNRVFYSKRQPFRPPDRCRPFQRRDPSQSCETANRKRARTSERASEHCRRHRRTARGRHRKTRRYRAPASQRQQGVARSHKRRPRG